MALSMDEQRMLAEIERRLSAEDPGLATRLSSFRRPGPVGKLRSPRGRVIGTMFTVALVAVISMMVYAMVPFRAHNPKTTSSPQASGRPGISAPARTGLTPSAATHSGATTTSTRATPAGTGQATTPKAATVKVATPKAGTQVTRPAAHAGTPAPAHT